MTNNIKVSILAFAGGITFGLLTVYVLIANGLMLGAFAGRPPAGLRDPLDWCAYIFPHGVIELTAICIAGGAGLILAWALIAPGNLTRWDSLRKSAREALPLIGGVAVMLVIAGIIEGSIARSELARSLKLGVAALTFLALVAYFGFAGRESSAGSRASSSE